MKDGCFMSQPTVNPIGWTSAELELLETNEWKRYKIGDGELFVTCAPHLGHQDAAGQSYAELLLYHIKFP